MSRKRSAYVAAADKLCRYVSAYWETCMATPLPGFDVKRYWLPSWQAREMMYRSWDVLPHLAELSGLSLEEKREFQANEATLWRYVTYRWGEIKATFVFPIHSEIAKEVRREGIRTQKVEWRLVRNAYLSAIRSIRNVPINSGLYLVVLPFPPSEKECAIAQRVRNSGLGLLLVAPSDFNALVSRLWSVEDMLLYKTLRVVMLGKVDTDALYDEFEFARFVEVTKKVGLRRPTSFIDVDTAISTQEIHPRDSIQHPIWQKLLDDMLKERTVFVVGQSASGKTNLALAAGHYFKVAQGRQVWYLDMGSITEDETVQVGIHLLSRNGQHKALLLLIDDLQTNYDTTRKLLTFLTLVRNILLGNQLQILAICWPEFLKDLDIGSLDAVIHEVSALQLINLMSERFGAGLSENQLKLAKGIAGDDLLILSLCLSVFRDMGHEVQAQEIAEHIWKRRSEKCRLPETIKQRAILAATTIGQYECEITRSFMSAQTGISDSDIDKLRKAKLVRQHNGDLTAGHRSYCQLIAAHLGSLAEHWNWFKQQGKACTPEALVLEYVKSLPPQRVHSVLEAIHAHGAARVPEAIRESALVVLDAWRTVNDLLEKIVNQQQRDPTWSQTISSATFAIEALCSLGKATEATESLRFIRDSYFVDSGVLHIKVEELSTQFDFEEIKKRMLLEDRSSSYYSRNAKFEPAETVDERIFHENWASGLVLCAEASYSELDERQLNSLAEGVEQRISDDGFFYPARVPWCAGRILMGLGACGRNIENSNAVSKAVQWLLTDISEGGVYDDGIWNSGTGEWNSWIETTALCLIGLLRVGVDPTHSKLSHALDHLFQSRDEWIKRQSELDGAIALQAYSMMTNDWQPIIGEMRELARWAKGQALWMHATSSARDTFNQSCRVAQVASVLIDLIWQRITTDLPSLLGAFTVPKSEESRESLQADVGDMVSVESNMLSLIQSMKTVRLADYSVVGNYLRYNEKDRHFLRDYYVMIRAAVAQKTKSRQNYLFWGSPSAGKTYLAEEIARVLASEYQVEYQPLNIALLDRGEFEDRLSKVERTAETHNVICCIDEFDSKLDEGWPIELLFPLLDLNLSSKCSIVWILIGSSKGNLESFLSDIEARHKGTDFLSRIPQDNIVAMPFPEAGDQLLTCVSEIDKCASEQSKPIRFVENFALFYLGYSPYGESKRQLRELVQRAVNRVPVGDDRVKYDNLFEPGDHRNKEFWKQYYEKGGSLLDTYLSFHRE